MNGKLDVAAARRLLHFVELRDCCDVESARVAIRRTPGTASIRISCRSPSSSPARMLMPVVLPSSRTSELTNPSPTISSVAAMIGIVFVACLSRARCYVPENYE